MRGAGPPPAKSVRAAQEPLQSHTRHTLTQEVHARQSDKKCELSQQGCKAVRTHTNKKAVTDVEGCAMTKL